MLLCGRAGAGGLLIFTLERAAEPSDGDYRLEHHGRYSHTGEYVERLLAASALEPTITHADLRLEGGMPVAGLLVRARKANRGRARAERRGRIPVSRAGR